MRFYIWIYIWFIIFGIIIQKMPNITIKIKNVYYQNSFFFLYVAGSVLSIIMGIRDSSVGYDTQMYGRIFTMLGKADLFESVPNSVKGYWGYRLICKIVYVCSGSYQVFLFITAVITIGGVFRFIKYTSENYFMSVMIYYASFMYLQAFNGARQCLAISVCLNAYVELERKKYLRSIILSIIACMIHNTAIIMFIIYPIKFIRWSYEKLSIFIFAMSTICVSIDPVIKLFLFFFPRYAVIYTPYLRGNVSTMFGGVASGRKVFVSIFYILVILVALYFTDREKMDEGFASNWSLIALSVVEGIIGIIFMHNSMMLRIQLYFSFFVISCLPNCIERMRVSKKIKNIFNLGICMVMVVPFSVQLSSNYGHIVPYLIFTQG